MKTQWMLILGSIFSLVIAIFAMINNRQVRVNYLFGEMTSPLILVILLSFITGAIVSACFAMFRLVKLQNTNKRLNKRLKSLEMDLKEKQAEMNKLNERIIITQREH